MTAFAAALYLATIALSPVFVAAAIIVAAAHVVNRLIERHERTSRKAVEEAHFGLWAEELSDR